jgi:GT2 family glycosyltransferase/serine acetyltransferase
MMRLAIVILTHRGAAMVEDCLASLAGQIAPDRDRVVVVDNGSGPGTAARLRRLLASREWDWASVLALERNGGFCVGNNAALRAVLAAADPPEYVLLLNDDTYLRPGALQSLFDFMQRHPQAAIAGCRLEDPDGTPQRSAMRYPGIASEFEQALRLGVASRLLHRFVVAPPPRDEAHPTDWVAGAAMLVRTEVFREIGLLDEGYFLYFDDVDFCRRATRAGHQVWYVPQSRIVHLVARTTGLHAANPGRQRLPAYWFESRRHYFQKNHGWWYATAADVALATGALLRRVRSLIDPVSGHPQHFLRDVALHGLWPRKIDRSGGAAQEIGLSDLLREDWIAHERDWTRPGFRAVAVCRLGRRADESGRRWLRVLCRVLYRRVRNRYGIELPATVRLGRRVVFEHQSGIVVHGAAEIGDECIVRQGVTLGNRRLDRPQEAPRLGLRVSVGAGAQVLGAVVVGDGAQIGANAVVLADVPPGATAVGIPARLVLRREPEE